MKKIFSIILTIISLSSCNKFLDVQPESSVTRERLFSTETGFQEALNGIYTKCSSDSLYGGNLTFSNLDIFAQNYTFSNTDFQKIASFQYKDPILKNKNSLIWAAAYNAIANCNEILTAVDAKQGIFSDNNFAIVKAEALALRAYLHFDIFRMFSGTYTSSPSAKGIPYVETTGIQTTPFSTREVVINKLITDLETARELLRGIDPIIPATYVIGYPNKIYADANEVRQTENAASSLFLQNRRHRINYYAICAELARVYLYANNKVKALELATEVINSGRFPWTLKDDAFNNNIEQKDRIFYKELIFGWYVPTAEKMLVALFSQANVAQYQPTPLQLDNIYERTSVGAEDWRYRQWFSTARDVTPNRSYLIKYLTNTTPLVNLHPLMAPAIRLSEMYYIAAEASFDNNPQQATAFLNDVRTHRGIIDMLPTLTKNGFISELTKEYRKEFYGESQLFFMLKRLNQDIISASGQVYPASESIYVLPIPDDENAYNQ